MTRKNIDFVPLYYETILDYARDNWNNVNQFRWSATEYNYRKIFTNYDLISSIVQNTQKLLTL